MSKLKTSIVVTMTAIATVMFAGCAAEPEAKQPSSASSSGTKPTTNGPSCDPKVGAKAPVLSIDSMNGGGKMAITPGKVTLVDFWATWCGPCQSSFPKYQDLYSKYKSRGFEIIAVSGDDDKKEIPAFITKYRAKFPVGWDQGHEIASCWKPATNPTAYLIDKKGVVRHIHAEWHEGDEKKLEEQIKSLL